jgi:hypothetical protein
MVEALTKPTVNIALTLITLYVMELASGKEVIVFPREHRPLATVTESTKRQQTTIATAAVEAVAEELAAWMVVIAVGKEVRLISTVLVNREVETDSRINLPQRLANHEGGV